MTTFDTNESLFDRVFDFDGLDDVDFRIDPTFMGQFFSPAVDLTAEASEALQQGSKYPVDVSGIRGVGMVGSTVFSLQARSQDGISSDDLLAVGGGQAAGAAVGWGIEAVGTTTVRWIIGAGAVAAAPVEIPVLVLFAIGATAIIGSAIVGSAIEDAIDNATEATAAKNHTPLLRSLKQAVDGANRNALDAQLKGEKDWERYSHELARVEEMTRSMSTAGNGVKSGYEPIMNKDLFGIPGPGPAYGYNSNGFGASGSRGEGGRPGGSEGGDLRR